MHPNPSFRKADTKQNLDFARTRSFGTLAVNSESGPLLAHIPFLVNETGDRLEAHLVRSNPVLGQIGEGTGAVVSITGPHSYISPDWYEMGNQVPTWNYIAVHIRGKLTRLPDENLTGILERLSDNFENLLLPKPEWKMSKVETSSLEKLKRMIVPVSMEISQIDGTWKLAQNKPDEARLAAADEVGENGIGSELEQLAAMMKEPPC